MTQPITQPRPSADSGTTLGSPATEGESASPEATHTGDAAPAGVTDTTSDTASGDVSGAGGSLALWTFAGDTRAYLQQLLTWQCQLAPAVAGAVLRVEDGQAGACLASVPPPHEVDAQGWLEQVMPVLPPALLRTEPSLIRGRRSFGQSVDPHTLIMPLHESGTVRAVAVYLLRVSEPELSLAVSRLGLLINLAAMHELRQAAQQQSRDLAGLREAMDLLGATNAQDTLLAAAMAFCNQVSQQCNAQRVSVGFMPGRQVKLVAMSHTERIDRKTAVTQAITQTMEECLDQDIEVLHPAPPQSTFIHRAAEHLSQRHGPSVVLSMPLRRQDQAVAALTIERRNDQPFALNEIERLRLAADLVTPRLLELYDRDKWLGARLVDHTRRSLAWVVGAEHTWIKAAAVLMLGVVLFAVLVRGTERVEGTFVVKADQQRAVAAPFDGTIVPVMQNARPGQAVHAGDVLAQMDVTPLLAELAAAIAQRDTHEKEAAIALGNHKPDEQQLAEAQARRAAADIALTQDRLNRATVLSPLGGVIASGESRVLQRKSVKTGEVLYEIADVTSLYAELSVPEDRIADVHEGMRGTLASAAYPGRYLPFVVTDIHPVAVVSGGKNVFHARLRLLPATPFAASPDATTQPASHADEGDWLRPGMEGIAKVDVRQARYGWLWTRDLVQWVRMKLWL